jgi:Protein of unknown function (DUF3048) N-terminal domain/Protein of unknown function (DUF3048) C-terminal domain
MADTRKAGFVAAAVALVSVTAGCSGHHKAAAPPPTTVATTTTTVAPSTTTHPKPPPRQPLTGLPQGNRAQFNAVAVVIKVDNVDQARPQTGINQADVVYEEMVEGGLTRLAAIYQSQYPAVVGPVRSGRLTDMGIIDDLNHPVYAYAGANGNEIPVLYAQPATNLNINNRGDLFYRSGFNAPHNLFTHVAALAASSTTHAPPGPLFSYLAAGHPFAGALVGPAATVTIGFPNASVGWTYSASERGWLRTQNGTPDVDSAGRPVDPANVVIEFVPYITAGIAGGEGVPPAPIPEGLQTGSGAAWVFSAGKVVRGTWTRPALTTPAVFKDGRGAVISLTPGQTWVELVPAGTVPAVTP